MPLSTRQILINQAKEHFNAAVSPDSLGGADGKFARTFMARASVNAENTDHIKIPPIVHYRDCYKQSGEHENPIKSSASLCRTHWHSEKASDGYPRQLLISNDYKDDNIGDDKKRKCFPRCTRTDLCKGIIRQIQNISSPDANVDVGGDNSVNRNLKTIMDMYHTEYPKIFAEAESTIRREIDTMKKSDVELNLNRSKISENMAIVKQKEKILNNLRKSLEERSQSLLSSKTQGNLKKEDRVRIGPAVLPLFYVPTRSYVIAALAVIVILLVALIIYAKSGNNSGPDATAEVTAPSEEGNVEEYEEELE